MKKYKQLWLNRTDTGKVLVNVKIGVIYIADSKEEAIDQAQKRRSGDYPIYFVGYKGGCYFREQVAP